MIGVNVKGRVYWASTLSAEMKPEIETDALAEFAGRAVPGANLCAAIPAGFDSQGARTNIAQLLVLIAQARQDSNLQPPVLEMCTGVKMASVRVSQ